MFILWFYVNFFIANIHKWATNILYSRKLRPGTTTKCLPNTTRQLIWSFTTKCLLSTSWQYQLCNWTKLCVCHSRKCDSCISVSGICTYPSSCLSCTKSSTCLFSSKFNFSHPFRCYSNLICQLLSFFNEIWNLLTYFFQNNDCII